MLCKSPNLRQLAIRFCELKTLLLPNYLLGAKGVVSCYRLCDDHTSILRYLKLRLCFCPFFSGWLKEAQHAHYHWIKPKYKQNNWEIYIKLPVLHIQLQIPQSFKYFPKQDFPNDSKLPSELSTGKIRGLIFLSLLQSRLETSHNRVRVQGRYACMNQQEKTRPHLQWYQIIKALAFILVPTTYSFEILCTP